MGAECYWNSERSVYNVGPVVDWQIPAPLAVSFQGLTMVGATRPAMYQSCSICLYRGQGCGVLFIPSGRIRRSGLYEQSGSCGVGTKVAVREAAVTHIE